MNRNERNMSNEVNPSMVMNEYRIHYALSDKKISMNKKNYFEVQVPFADMDQCWKFAKSMVDAKQAAKISITTKVAHFYFKMGMAVIAIYPTEYLDINDMHSLLSMVFAHSDYFITKKSVVFN